MATLWVLVIMVLDSGSLQIPMANQDACLRAASEVTRFRREFGYCINTETGEVLVHK